MHSWGGVRWWVVTTGGLRNIHGCVLYVFVSMCGCEEQTEVVIAQEEPCAQRTLKLIKGRDRVIIHHGPLERLTPKSLLLINSETVLRINNDIKKGIDRSAYTSWIWFKCGTMALYLPLLLLFSWHPKTLSLLLMLCLIKTFKFHIFIDSAEEQAK